MITCRIFITVLVLLISILHTVLSKHCYQCDSTLDSNCQEIWDHKLSINRQKYTSCDLWDAKYCIKITGMWGGVVGTHRFCSSRDMGDQCQDIWFPDHDRLYRACVYTCTDDGCNSANSLGAGKVAALLVSALTSVLLMTWRDLR